MQSMGSWFQLPPLPPFKVGAIHCLSDMCLLDMWLLQELRVKRARVWRTDGWWYKQDNDPLGNPLFHEVFRQVFPAKKSSIGEEATLLNKFTSKTIAFVLLCVYSNLLCTEGIGGWALEYLTTLAPSRLTPQEAQVSLCVVCSLSYEGGYI